MQLDDLKASWLSLEQQLEQSNSLQIMQLLERKQQGARSSLRPLFVGQCLQILAGLVLVFFAAPFWGQHVATTHLLAVGLVLHVYGIVLIITAVRLIVLMRAVVFDAPVVAVQKQLLKVERNYIMHGWLIGLPWWLLWIPFALFVAALLGFDMYAGLPHTWLWSSTVFGVLGMAVTLLGVQWARKPARPALAAKINAALAGRSLVNARRQLADIERFEQGAA